LVSDVRDFASIASLVRPGGTAVSTRYVADLERLQAQGILGRNFALRQSSDLLERVARALAKGIVNEPPITQIALEDVPGLFDPEWHPSPDGKTVIVL
jgi:hypothetical protein